MMTNFNKVREYLLNLEYDILSEDLQEELFVVSNPSGAISNLVIDCEEPILIIEGILCPIAQDDPALYKELLQKNRELVHGALTLDQEAQNLLFRDTLELENLDQNELEGTLNALELLLAEYSERLLEIAQH